MDKIFYGARAKSEVTAISSKSEAHRLLICAALGDRMCEIVCIDTNADIDATVRCLNSLGADIKRTETGFSVTPIKQVSQSSLLDCNESGSTLRFLLPLAASLGADCSFAMRGRLAQRPLSPLRELLEKSGVTISPIGSNPLEIQGNLPAGSYSIASNVSSQFISGMLFALSVADGESRLSLEGKTESAPYIDLTVNALHSFGADILFDDKKSYIIKGKKRLSSPNEVIIGGDWSNAAFFLVAGAIGKNPVTVSSLDENSSQGDRKILNVLAQMGANIEKTDVGFKVSPSKLQGIELDASDIPDLVPIVAVAASVAEGETKIFGAERLRLKESDRIESIYQTLSTLGADVTPTDSGLSVRGKAKLLGGEVDSFNDHRIAMSAAVASLVCENAVKIKNFEAINKSYPSFADNFI